MVPVMAGQEKRRNLRRNHIPELNTDEIFEREDPPSDFELNLEQALETLLGTVPVEVRERVKLESDALALVKRSKGQQGIWGRQKTSPRATPPSGKELLEGFTEISALAEAAFRTDPGELFDFEVEALQELVELGRRIRSFRATAEDVARPTVAVVELAELYDKMAAAWRYRVVPTRHMLADESSTQPPRRQRSETLTAEQKSAESALVAGLLSWNERNALNLSPEQLEGFRVHGFCIKEQGGPRRAAEYLFREIVLQDPVPATGGNLTHHRALVSGRYLARATRRPFSAPSPGGQAQRAGKLWESIHLLAGRPTSTPEEEEALATICRGLLLLREAGAEARADEWVLKLSPVQT